jgi:hypothetical protein
VNPVDNVSSTIHSLEFKAFREYIWLQFLLEEGKTMGMRKSVLLTLIIILFSSCFGLPGMASAQTRGRTETGREVILYPDGTWKYAPETKGRPSPGDIYSKPNSANKLLKTERGSFGVWDDERKWRGGKTDEDGKVVFQLIGEDGYAMVLAEGMAIPTATLREMALENAQKAAEDSKIIFEEYRIVNGREILCLKLTGTIKQIPFTYYGYYYGGKEGAIQVITYTGQNLLGKYEKEFANFLNGLVILP